MPGDEHPFRSLMCLKLGWCLCTLCMQDRSRNIKGNRYVHCHRMPADLLSLLQWLYLTFVYLLESSSNHRIAVHGRRHAWWCYRKNRYVPCDCCSRDACAKQLESHTSIVGSNLSYVWCLDDFLVRHVGWVIPVLQMKIGMYIVIECLWTICLLCCN